VGLPVQQVRATRFQLLACSWCLALGLRGNWLERACFRVGRMVSVMTESTRNDDVRKTDFQERFRNAEGDNVMQQAGANLGEGGAPKPVPGERLTGKEAEAEIGRDPNAHEKSDAYRGEVKEMEARKTRAESDALREQYSGDASETDSNIEANKTRARVESVVTGNPD
jgi:hypothetical protein